MELKDASTFVTNFKGAALSCLILMWAMRDHQRNWNRNELASLTGWSREPIASGLKKLALHGLALRLNTETWQLTDKGFQFSFADLRVEKIDSESRKIRLVGSSSSLLINHDMHETNDLKPQLPLPLGVEKFDSYERDRLAEILVIRCACPPQRASEAVTRALKSGLSPLLIEYRILIWLAYSLAEIERGQKLSTSNFVQSRITQQCCPDSFDLDTISGKHHSLYTAIRALEQKLDEQEKLTNE